MICLHRVSFSLRRGLLAGFSYFHVRVCESTNVRVGLLHALPVRIRLWLVYDRTVVEVADARSEISDVLRHPRHAVVIDVLRLVRHLVVIARGRRS